MKLVKFISSHAVLFAAFFIGQASSIWIEFRGTGHGIAGATPGNQGAGGSFFTNFYAVRPGAAIAVTLSGPRIVVGQPPATFIMREYHLDILERFLPDRIL